MDSKMKQEFSIGKFTIKHDISKDIIIQVESDIMKQFAPLLSQRFKKSKSLLKWLI